MSDTSAEPFIGRVLEQLEGMPRDRFSSKSWRFEDRPTSEGVGLKPGID